MKQYFTGFFTALCLTTSAFLFFGAKDYEKEIVLKDEEGITVLNASGVFALNKEGKVISHFGRNNIYPNTGGSFQIFDNDGEIRVASYTDLDDSGGKVTLYSPNSQVGAMLSADEKGGNLSVLSSKTKSGESRWRGGLYVTEDSDGQLLLLNDKGNFNAMIGSLHGDGYKGDGFINLFDRYGDLGWSVSGKN